MEKGSRFWVKVYKAIPMLDNPEVSCGFEIKCVEEMWVVKFIADDSILGWNPKKDELRVFPRREITRWEE